MLQRNFGHWSTALPLRSFRTPTQQLLEKDFELFVFVCTCEISRECYIRTVLSQYIGRSQWPRGPRCGSAAARLLRSWVRIPPGAWMFVCCECCVLSGRGLCDKLITCPEESYRLWCVVVCDLENLKNEEAITRVGSQRHRKKNLLTGPIACLWICNLGYDLTVCYENFGETLHLWSPEGK